MVFLLEQFNLDPPFPCQPLDTYRNRFGQGVQIEAGDNGHDSNIIGKNPPVPTPFRNKEG
jgi:hypothetical protein